MRHASEGSRQGDGESIEAESGEAETAWPRRGTVKRIDFGLKRLLDFVLAAALLIVLAPVFGCLAIAVKLDSPGPVFYRCRRVGFRGREFAMVKFRKMRDGASGPALTLASDDRLTRLGRFLTASKLDELPQLWNVLKGEMSLVGPRPEDRQFVALHPDSFERILAVRPGITGLAQLAFAREGTILDPGDRVAFYVTRLLPQKIGIDVLYASRRTLLLDLRILLWTAVAVFLRRDLAVHRQTGRLTLRRRPEVEILPAPLEGAALVLTGEVEAGYANTTISALTASTETVTGRANSP